MNRLEIGSRRPLEIALIALSIALSPASAGEHDGGGEREPAPPEAPARGGEQAPAVPAARENSLPKLIDALGSDSQHERTAAEKNLEDRLITQLPIVYPELKRVNETTTDPQVQRTTKKLLGLAPDIDFKSLILRGREEIRKEAQGSIDVARQIDDAREAMQLKKFSDLKKTEMERVLLRAKLEYSDLKSYPGHWKFTVTDASKRKHHVDIDSTEEFTVSPANWSIKVDFAKLMSPTQRVRYGVERTPIPMTVPFAIDWTARRRNDGSVEMGTYSNYSFTKNAARALSYQFRDDRSRKAISDSREQILESWEKSGFHLHDSHIRWEGK